MAVPTKLISTSQGFQSANGTVVALGSLSLTLTQNAEVTASGGQVTTEPLYFQLDANGKITSSAIWFNDELTPSGTTYRAILYASNGMRIIQDFGYWSITGASADLSTMIPTSIGGASAAGVVLLNPSVNQTIVQPAGTALAITGNFSVTGNASFKTSPWYDVTSYGAKGDGTTDDTAAFQAALTAANAAHGGKVFVPMGTAAYVIAGQLVMDDFIDVAIVGASGGSPAGATPRSWMKFTGTTSPLISMKSANGCVIKGNYIQYTNAAFAGTVIELGHSALAKDATGNRIEDNFIGKTAAGGTAAVLISLDQAIDNIIENNQLFDAAVAIRGRNGPTGIAADYSVNNTIRCNSMGVSNANSITTAFIQNIGEGSVIEGNDFELAGSAVAVLAYTGAMAAGGIISGGFVGDQSGASTYTLFTIPTNSAWVIQGVLIGTISVNVTGVVMQNNSSLSFIGNKLASGNTIGTLFSLGTGDTLNVLGTFFQGVVTTFLTGTPAAGVITAANGRTSIYGEVLIPDGTATVAGIGFTANPSIGFYRSVNNHLQVAYNAAGPWFNNNFITIGSGMTLAATSTADPDAAGADVGLSRGAAGLWLVGTGAAGNKAGLIQSGNTVRLTADLTLAANTSLQTVFSIALPAFANNYNFHVSIMYSQATAAVADAFGVQCSVTAPTNLVANGIVYTAAAVSTSGTSGNITTTSATNVLTFTPSAITTVFTAVLEGQVEVGASGGTLNIMASQSNSADLLTIKRGSYIQLF